MSIIEIQEAAKVITESIDKDAKVIFGTIQDERLKKGEIKVNPYQAYNGQTVTSPLGKIQHSYSVPMQQTMQMDADALAILNNQALSVPGEEGLRDIRIVEAIYRAASTGKSIRL